MGVIVGLYRNTFVSSQSVLRSAVSETGIKHMNSILGHQSRWIWRKSAILDYRDIKILANKASNVYVEWWLSEHNTKYIDPMEQKNERERHSTLIDVLAG